MFRTHSSHASLNLSVVAAALLTANFNTTARAKVDYAEDPNPASKMLSADDDLACGSFAVDTATVTKNRSPRKNVMAIKSANINGAVFVRKAFDETDAGSGAHAMNAVDVAGVPQTSKKTKKFGVAALGLTLADNGHTQHAGAKLANTRRERILANNASAATGQKATPYQRGRRQEPDHYASAANHSLTS